MTPAQSIARPVNLSTEEREGYRVHARLSRRVSVHETLEALVLKNGNCRLRHLYTWKGGDKSESMWGDWIVGGTKNATEITKALRAAGWKEKG